MMCKTPNCSNPADSSKPGYCKTHYNQWMRDYKAAKGPTKPEKGDIFGDIDPSEDGFGQAVRLIFVKHGKYAEIIKLLDYTDTWKEVWYRLQLTCDAVYEEQQKALRDKLLKDLPVAGETQPPQ